MITWTLILIAINSIDGAASIVNVEQHISNEQTCNELRDTLAPRIEKDWQKYRSYKCVPVLEPVPTLVVQGKIK